MDDLFGCGTIEDITATDQDIDTDGHKARGRLTLYTTIHLDERLTPLLGNHPTKAPDLLDRILNELLSAEAWVDTHQQHHVDIADNVLQERDGRRGIERHAGLHARIVDFLYSAVQMGAGFHVHIHHHGSQPGGALNILFGVHHHVMHVKRLLAFAGHGLKDRESERDVWHEHAVHHV